MSKHSMRRGQLRQVQPLAAAARAPRPSRPCVRLRSLKALLGVLRAISTRSCLLAALRHAAPAPARPSAREQQLRQRLEPLSGSSGSSTSFGHEVVVVVVEVHERGEQLLVGELLAAEGERLAAVEPPLPHVEHVDEQPIGLAVEAEHVLVDRLGGRDLLPLEAALDAR